MPNPRTSWTSVLCDSLEKVFPDADPRPMDTGITQHVFAGETIAVQVALKPPTQRAGRPPEVDVEVVTGVPELAFERLITFVRDHPGEEREAARKRLLALFETIGSSDPRVLKARRALTTALF